MHAQPRILLTALPALALAACFDPLLGPGDGDGSTTDGSTTDPSADGSTTTDRDADSTDGQADSTGNADASPEIIAFTVNNSTMPPEQQTAGMATFDVDASDDIGIDRIEIYDGDELVTTVVEAPYVAEILVSSADNGSHSYSAVVFDTAGQTAESEVVPLSVNIVGGAILELREDIGDVQIALLGIGAPKLAVVPEGDIVVTGMARLEPGPDLRTGLLGRGYSEELGLLWAVEHAPPPGDLATEYFGFSAPSIAPSAAIAYVGGAAELESGMQSLSVFSVDVRTGALVQSHELWMSSGAMSYVPVFAAPNGDVVGTSAIAEVARFSPDFSTEHWHSVPLGAGVFELASTSEGEAIVVFAGNDCAPGASLCLCKLSSEGDVLWTRAVAETTDMGIPTRPAISSNGHIAVASAAADGSGSVLIFDSQGDELANMVLDGEGELQPLSIAYDPSGALVVAGGSLQLDMLTAWATRLREDKQVVWEHVYEIGSSDSAITGVAVSSTGRLYVSGYAEPFDLDFLTYGARTWIAELAL